VMGPGAKQDALPVTLIANQVFGGHPEDRANAIAASEANTRAVMTEVPPDRLLVMHLGEGWDRLCAHLGVPVPDRPYPRRNSAEELMARTATL
jgi:Sulfotransferase domain